MDIVFWIKCGKTLFDGGCNNTFSWTGTHVECVWYCVSCWNDLMWGLIRFWNVDSAVVGIKKSGSFFLVSIKGS